MDGAAGFEGLGFPGVVNGQVEGAAVPGELFDLLAEVGGVDDHLPDAGAAEGFQVILQQGLAAHFQQGLGRVVGQRAHALAQPRGENHGFHAAASPARR